MDANSDYPLEVDVQFTKSLLDDSEDFLLLDCREQQEVDVARIEGSTHIPMAQTPTRVGELENYRDKRIVVHCHLGGRSLQVTQWLRQQGFVGAQNMTGGIDLWSQLIDTSVPRYQ